MKDPTNQSSVAFDAAVVISPGFEGDHQKNQDRAKFYPGNQVAVLCDGISTSPYSDVAAEIGVTATPGIFSGDYRERLGSLSDTLLAHRLAAQFDPIVVRPGTSPAIVPALQEAVRHQMASAFQTTLVAAQLTAVSGQTQAKILCCGDSALFAFGADGTLVTSTRSWAAVSNSQDSRAAAPPKPRPLYGARALVKVLGPLPNWPELVSRSAIPAQHRRAWIVCTPLDVLDCPMAAVSKCDPSLVMQPLETDFWLVPAFILGRAPAVGTINYRLIHYSRNIRHISNDVADGSLAVDTSITPVLPDHFATGRWVYTEEKFAPDTHFVLASDGFYHCFADEAEMWAWLVQHEAALKSPLELFDGLHERISSQSADDDISLVWVRPIAFPAGSAIDVAPVTTRGEMHCGR